MNIVLCHIVIDVFLIFTQQAMHKRENSFVHFVLDPVVDNSPKDSFAVRYGWLVHIDSVSS
jgi:hypothetical protein